LSRIGLPFVNCVLIVSPKVRITTLLSGLYVPALILVVCAFEKTDGKKIPVTISEEIINKLIILI
jgi:hypothetical protein